MPADLATVLVPNYAPLAVERPGIKLPTEVPVYVYAVTEGAVWGAAGGLILSQGFTALSLGSGIVGGVLGFVVARWYLPRVRGTD